MLSAARTDPSTAQWLIFQSNMSNDWQFYRMAPDGSRLKRLTDREGAIIDLGFSYQGISDDLVYFHDHDHETLVQMTVHGHNMTTILDGARLHELFAIHGDWTIMQDIANQTIIGLFKGEERWRTPPNVEAQGLDISPDGQWLLYTDYSYGNPRIYKIHLDGTGARAVIDLAERMHYRGWLGNDLLLHEVEAQRLLRVSTRDGQWTPILQALNYRLLSISGDNLLYVADDKPGLMRLHIPSGDEWMVASLYPITLNYAVLLGDWIYYATRDAVGNAYLYRVMDDGQFPQLVHEAQAVFRYLGVAPGGQMGIYATEKEVWTFTNSTIRRLPMPEAPFEFKRWSPDGRWLYFDTGSIAQRGDIMRIEADGSPLEWLVVENRDAFLITAGPVQDRPWHRDLLLVASLAAFLVGVSGVVLISR